MSTIGKVVVLSQKIMFDILFDFDQQQLTWARVLILYVWRTALCGSEAQKQKYLPSLAQFKTVGCWVSHIIQ